MTAGPPSRRAALIRALRGTRVWSSRRLEWAPALWRRSLQLRVAVTTTLVTTTVVLLIGVFLVDQIAAGIVDTKRSGAIAQANAGLDQARAQFADVAPGDLSGISVAAQKTTDASLTASNTGLFLIVVRSSDAAVDGELSHGPTIPAPLRAEVQRGNQATQFAPISGVSQGRSVPGLIVGEPVAIRAGIFELYYLFPLTAEQNTIDLVRQTVLIAGIALVLLVLGITLLVTRQVVRPIRLVSRAAEQLSTGDLSRRIEIRGSDDLAVLGASFNDMAGSMQQQIQRLEALSRLQQRFTSDVSHELRTPLTTVRMAAELLYAARKAFAPELARSAELLTNELDRFEGLLGDLLEISRYDAGVAYLEVERLDLSGIVERAVASSQALATRHAVELRLTTPAGPVLVEVDARRVERILRNLIGNALDHAEGKPVDIAVAADAEAAAVTVRDHGVGLKPGEAALVFNRFWRGDPSRSRLTGGTGLGLAISFEDAHLHEGWLQAWGERGLGASFRLTLPRRAGQPLTSSPLPLIPDEVDA